jgi:hypothetical protein
MTEAFEAALGATAGRVEAATPDAGAATRGPRRDLAGATIGRTCDPRHALTAVRVSHYGCVAVHSGRQRAAPPSSGARDRCRFVTVSSRGSAERTAVS